MVARIKERFITPETILALTWEWECMDLVEFQKKTPENSLLTSFNNMFPRLQKLQLCLSRSFHIDDLLKSRLLNAFANVEESRLARHKVSSTLMGVVADIQTSISTHKETVERLILAALVTGRRRFQQIGVPTWRGRRNSKPVRKFFVCKRFGCWLTNYTRKERTQSLKENTRLRAFVMDIHNVGNDENDHDQPDPLDDLEDLAVN